MQNIETNRDYYLLTFFAERVLLSLPKKQKPQV